MSSRLLGLCRVPAVALIIVVAQTVVPVPEAAAGQVDRHETADPVVRVRLFQIYRPEEIRLQVISGSLLVYREDSSLPAFSLEPGSSASLSIRRGMVQLQSRGIEDLRAGTIGFVPADSLSTYTLAVTAGARPSDKRSYSGEISFAVSPESGDQLLPVNAVNLEAYVAAVITTEYGLEDLDGNKAMAVLARTYALRSRGKFGADYDHVDHSISQVYHGVGVTTPVAMAAARSTAGEVLTYDGELVEAVYHAESGGATADNEKVWTGGKPIPYLRSIADPYANNSPYAKWTFRADRSRLIQALNRTYGGTVTGIRIGDVGRDGRVNTMEILRRRETLSIPANEFRLLFLRTFGQYSMKSTKFEVRRSGNSYEFSGQGFGHGVGMSQWGAHEMSKQGFTYTDILDFYFAGTHLASLTDISQTPIADAILADTSQFAVPEMEPSVEAMTVYPIAAPVRESKRKRRRGRIGW